MRDVEVTLQVVDWNSRSYTKKTGENGVIHKGIASRHFERSFTLSEDIKLKNAELKNGLLNIDLHRVIPEEKKSRLIEIN